LVSDPDPVRNPARRISPEGQSEIGPRNRFKDRFLVIETGKKYTEAQAEGLFFPINYMP
jgi:hypothetical protein